MNYENIIYSFSVSISHSLENIFHHLYTYITFQRGHEGNATWRSHLISLLFQLNQEVITALLSHLKKLWRKSFVQWKWQGEQFKSWMKLMLLGGGGGGGGHDIVTCYIPKFLLARFWFSSSRNCSISLYTIRVHFDTKRKSILILNQM